MARSISEEADAEIYRDDTIDMDSDYNSEGESDNAGGTIPVVLTNPNMLNCPICSKPLCSPIYQCVRGHLACCSCCVEENNKCPSCLAPIGSVRCRVMEKLTKYLRVKCKNKMSGCNEMLMYHEKSDHENTCLHTLCFCPLPSCNFASSYNNLYTHFSSLHSSSAMPFNYGTSILLRVDRSQKNIILRELNEGVIFILNHVIQGNGRVFNVDCIGPNTYKNAFVYQLTVKCGEMCLSLETIPEVCAKWEEHTPDNSYLTIPSGFSDYHIEVCIKNALDSLF